MTLRSTTGGALGLLTMLMIACTPGPPAPPPPPPDTRPADIAAIKTDDVNWEKDFAAHDLDKFVSHYTDDATAMGTGFPILKGKDAIRDGLKGLVTDPNTSMTFGADSIDVARSGDVGYARGRYELTMTDPKTKKVTVEHGAYVTVYKKQANGAWKAAEDIITSVAAAPEVKKK
jgi:uncharacterized protein (TIGR02246 family)